MSQKYILALNPSSSNVRDAVTAYFQGKNWGIWHWLEDVWLLMDVPDEITPRILWEELRGKIPALQPIRGVVLGVDDDLKFWGGVTPEAWPWMKEKWGKADFSPPATPSTEPASQSNAS